MIADGPIRSLAGAKPIDTVRRFYEAWIPGDIDSAIRFVAEDAVYNLYISEELLPVAGQTIGRANIEAGLRLVREQFEYLLYRPMELIADGEDVRHRVEFMYRHRASGEMLSGRFRIIIRVRDGLIVRCDEYHDRARVEAFLRLFSRTT